MVNINQIWLILIDFELNRLMKITNLKTTQQTFT